MKPSDEIPWEIAVEMLAMIESKDLPDRINIGKRWVNDVPKYLKKLRKRVKAGKKKRGLALEIKAVMEAYYGT